MQNTRSNLTQRVLSTTLTVIVGVIIGIPTGAALNVAGARDVSAPVKVKQFDPADLPSCAYEDASSGPLPCSWNIHAGDGNGEGLAYWVDGTHENPVFHEVGSR